MLSVSVKTKLGYVLIFGDKTHIVSVKLGVLPVESKEAPKFLLKAKKLFEEYFAGNPVDFSKIPVRLQGTDFQRRVWKTLRKVPYGHIKTYKWLADSIGCPCPRAVGNALRANKLSIIIPCHRIIRKDGSLGGFSAGLRWKRYLLELEGWEIDDKKDKAYHRL